MYRLAVPPAEDAVPLEATKLHIRVETDADDEIIEHYIKTATRWCESYQRRAYITQTWELWLDTFPRTPWILLTPSPLQSVEHVIYYDFNDQPHYFDDYFIDNVSEPGYVILNGGASWPSAQLRPANGVVVRFRAGYGDGEDVPHTILQAIVLLVGHWYENREAVVSTGAVPQRMPFSVQALLNQDKVYLL